jgi:hypothetical protein
MIVFIERLSSLAKLTSRKTRSTNQRTAIRIIERGSKCLFEKTYGRNAFDLASRDWRFWRNAVVSGLMRSPQCWSWKD